MLGVDLFFTLAVGGAAAALGVVLSAASRRRPSSRPDRPLPFREERRLEADLPFGLERVASALSAGCSLQQALALTGPASGSLLGRLFDSVLDRVRAGESLEDALRRAGSRCRGRALPLAFLTMATALRSGANLVESLHILARVSRDRETMRRKIEALTAQGRLQGIILSFTPLFFLAALSLVSPGSIRLLVGTSLGRIFLLVALVLDVAGALVIRRMVGKEVY